MRGIIETQGDQDHGLPKGCGVPAGTPEKGAHGCPTSGRDSTSLGIMGCPFPAAQGFPSPQLCHWQNFSEWGKVSEDTRETPSGAAGRETTCPTGLETEWAPPRAPAATSPLTQQPAPGDPAARDLHKGSSGQRLRREWLGAGRGGGGRRRQRLCGGPGGVGKTPPGPILKAFSQPRRL